MKWFFLFFWLELIVLFSSGCAAPKQRRGDWMEHLNHKQFNFAPPMVHWDRQNYYSLEELEEMWAYYYGQVVEKSNNKEK